MFYIILIHFKCALSFFSQLLWQSSSSLASHHCFFWWWRAQPLFIFLFCTRSPCTPQIRHGKKNMQVLEVKKQRPQVFWWGFCGLMVRIVDRHLQTAFGRDPTGFMFARLFFSVTFLMVFVVDLTGFLPILR